MRCANCGREEDQHCIFEAPPPAPDGCVCDEGSWGNTIPEPCNRYVGDKDQYCHTCEHDKACHKEPQP